MSVGQRFALAGLGTLGLAVVTVIDLIFDVVLGPAGALAAAVVAFAVFIGLRVVVPMAVRRRVDEEPDRPA